VATHGGELLGLSDAVLLDCAVSLPRARGTAFEIRLLAERDALKRTVILIDAETDLPAIEQTIATFPAPRYRKSVSYDRMDRSRVTIFLPCWRPARPAAEDRESGIFC